MIQYKNRYEYEYIWSVHINHAWIALYWVKMFLANICFGFVPIDIEFVLFPSISDALLDVNVILSMCVQIMELLVNKGISFASPPPIIFEELCLNTNPP